MKPWDMNAHEAVKAGLHKLTFEEYKEKMRPFIENWENGSPTLPTHEIEHFVQAEYDLIQHIGRGK